MSIWDRIKIEKYDDKAGPDVFHFRISDPLQPKYRGFGSDRIEELAMLKAVSEFCERSTMFSSESNPAGKFSSNGFAAHRTPELAALAAQAELVERDMVICSWLSKRPPRWLSENLIPDEFSCFKNFGLKCLVGTLGTVGDIEVWVSLLISVNRDDFGCTFAASAGPDSLQAINTLFLNQRRNLTIFFASDRKSTHSLPISNDCINSPESHRTYYLCPKRKSAWNWMLESATQIPEFSKPTIVTWTIPIPFEVPWDIHVARAKSPALQPYFVGAPNSSVLNMNRLRDFGIKGLDEIYSEPHPLP